MMRLFKGYDSRFLVERKKMLRSRLTVDKNCSNLKVSYQSFAKEERIDERKENRSSHF